MQLSNTKSRRNVFKIIFAADARYDRPQLSFKEFMIIATVYNMNLNYLTTFLELVISNGAILVCIFYFVLTAVLGMPLSMLFVFLSSYSKKSYLAIWDCAPLLEGIGYSMATIRFTSECYNMMIAASAIMIIVDVLEGDLKNNLLGCNFYNVGSTSHICLPMTNRNFTVECTRDNKTLTSIQYYYSFVIRGHNRNTAWQTPQMNTSLVGYIAFVWVLVFFLSVVGFKRLKNITVNLQIVFSCIMAILALIILAHIEFDRHNFRHLANPEISMKFCVEIILHAAETTIVGNLIWLGTMKPEYLHPKYAVIITSPIKLLFLLLIVCSTTVSMQENMVAYDIKDKDCFNPTGSEIFLVLIPDVLFRFDIWQILTVLWYLSVFFFATLATLYSIIGLVDSITEKFNCLKKYTFIVCLILCIIGFSLSMWLTFNISFLIIKDWRHGGLIVLTAAMSLLINLAIFFMYSTRKVIEDYIFTYGKPPEKYWVALWKTAPIFTIFAFIFALTFQSRTDFSRDHNVWVISISHVQCSMVLIPVITIMIGRCCKNIKQRTLDYLTQPAPTWGPSDPEKKLARAKFFPQRDIKCRNVTLKCNHKCAVSNNLQYLEEVAYQKQKYLLAKQEMEREMLENMEL